MWHRTSTALSFILVLSLSACTPPQEGSVETGIFDGTANMTLKKLTPVMLTYDVDACVAFWQDFGMELTMSLPYEEQLGFAAVAKDGIELMYQHYEFAGPNHSGENRSVLYFEVESLDEYRVIAKKFEIVKPEHTTDYGAREIYIRDPAGNLIGFAEHSAKK